MVDFIKSIHKRSILANILHVLFYVAYVGLALAMLITFPASPWAAFALVVISKWRVIAVRPRYWWANILSNLPDALFGLGIIAVAWGSRDVAIQVLLVIVYLAWLTVIKPGHKRHMIMIQAGMSQFVAMWALFSFAYMLPLSVVIVIMFIIGISSARHTLSAYDEGDRGLLSMAWGFLLAQLGFVAWHWTIAYSVTPTLKVPQIAIITAAISILAERAYTGWTNDGKVSWYEIKWPTIFVGSLIIIILLFFSGLWDASTL